MSRLLSVCAIGLLAVACHTFAQEPPKERFVEIAGGIVKAINAGDAEAFRKDFGDAMLKALPPEKCPPLFDQLKSKFGAIAKLDPPTLSPPGKAVFVAHCERGKLDVTLSLDEKGKVTGLKMLPHSDLFVPAKNETAMALPFTGKWLIFWGGETPEQNGHHVKDRAQRFAFDLVGAGPDGKRFTGKGTRNEDYACFGRDILAPADGVVLEVIDGVHDNAPRSMNGYSALGNAVFIQHGKHEVSMLAHLKQHSVKVKPGDAVKKGQLLGQCGNSGNSSEPHLHFHLQNTPRIEDATGVKCFFELVEVEKDGKASTQVNHMPVKGEVIGPAVKK